MIRKFQIPFCVLFLCAVIVQAQSVFQNPSFEGPSQPHVVPAPWNACYGTPDTQPGQWGFTQPPSHGSSYISMLQGGASSGSYTEGASQQLSPCLQAGTEYTFNIDIAFSPVYNTAEPGNCYGSMQIVGGNSLCGNSEILWQSGSFTNTNWQTTTITFTPSQNWCYITFHPYWITSCNGYINCMLDNISPIVPAVPTPPGIEITSPSANANMPCSFTVTGTTDTVALNVLVSGDFTGSPQQATILTDSTWQLTVTYPAGFNGSTTIIAGALFVDQSVDADTVTFNVVLPQADFTSNTVCQGTPTVFTNLSTAGTGNITNYNWNFGGGNVSTQQNPTHTFSTPGTFPVTLTITNDAGCTDSYTADVIVNPNPQVEFFAAPVCVGNATQFQNQTTLASGTVTQWNWDFGDFSGTDTQQNPAYQYANVATYNVTLSAVSDMGCTGTHTEPVSVNARPTANFSFVSGCSPTVAFTDLSTVPIGNVNAWNWNFGDFSTSNIQNPSHDYSFAGTFTVRLIAGSGLGCTDTMIQTVNVHAVPVANFAAPDVCMNSITNFTDLSSVSSGNIVLWNWNFGDSNTDTQQHPSHTYSNFGNFTVTLTVETDSGCTATFTRNVEVFANPVASFTGQNVCAETAINFDNTSSIASGNISQWFWDFGDFDWLPAIPNSTSMVFEPVFTYYTEGTYTVELIATSNNGCKDTVENTVTIHPVPQPFFTVENVCFGNAAEFINQSIISSGNITNYNWNFGNNQTSTQQSPVHNYGNTGLYTVTLTVTSNNNCSSTYTGRIRVHPMPVADFYAPDVCEGTVTNFTDQSIISLGSIAQWNWNFDDSNTSTLIDPQNLYNSSGIYNVQLVVTSDSACVDTVVKPVHVNAYPVVNFSAIPLDGCLPLMVDFTDLSTIEQGESIAVYNWDFGDGGTSAQQNPTHIFGTEGTFTITLTAVSADGCSTTVSNIDMITVFPKPNAAFNFGPQPTDIFDRNIIFTDLSSGATEWAWDFGDFTYDAVQHPQHLYSDSGNYIVQLIVTNQFGCKDTVAHLIRIDGAFALYIPSAFTPDGDRLNDTFTPSGFGFTKFAFRIFDRWGEQIFSTFTYGEAWDGTSAKSGKELPNDVYVYTVEVTDFKNERHQYKGTVTLVR